MRYLPELYAKAFFEVMKNTPEEKQGKIIRRFLQVIKRNGDYQMMEKIFKQIHALAVKARGGRMIILELAREISKELLGKLKNSFSENDYVEKMVRPELIAGVRILVDYEKELDFSMKRKLKEIFN